jgi:hypothetical protein
MNMVKRFVLFVISGAFLLMLSACAAEVGSEAWCEDMEDKERETGR